MKDDGSLFLVPDYDKLEGAYVECTDAIAREKIAHGFRNLRISGLRSSENKKKSSSSLSVATANDNPTKTNNKKRK